MSSTANIDPVENRQRMLAGELYTAFTADLSSARTECKQHTVAYNSQSSSLTRRDQVILMQRMLPNLPEIPKTKDGNTEEEDEALFIGFPYIEPPFRCDYGTQISIGKGSFINMNCTVIDTCRVTIGDRVLLGPSVSLYSGTHPTDPSLRNGIKGPEMGGEIKIEDDCWIGGSSILLPGVKIGRGSTVGAGSIVTKDVSPFSIVVGNPARFLKRVEGPMADEYFKLIM